METLWKTQTNNSEETKTLGSSLAKILLQGDVVLLAGDLGTGKTVFTKGIVTALTGVHEDFVTSPSFTIIQSYQGEAPVVHIDLYRIDDPREIIELDLESAMTGAITVIEWGDKILDWFPDHYFVEFRWINENSREITITKKTSTRV